MSANRGATWDLMRAVEARGGEIRTCESRFDHDAGGRVVTVVAFYPGDSGYPNRVPTPESGETK